MHSSPLFFFFFNDTATTEIYTLSLHDALPIYIVRGGVPLFTRDVSVGGNQYTDALQKELDLSFEDAERLKRGDSLPSVTDEQKQQILRSVSDILTLEIQKTFDFFRATARDRKSVV